MRAYLHVYIEATRKTEIFPSSRICGGVTPSAGGAPCSHHPLKTRGCFIWRCQQAGDINRTALAWWNYVGGRVARDSTSMEFPENALPLAGKRVGERVKERELWSRRGRGRGTTTGHTGNPPTKFTIPDTMVPRRHWPCLTTDSLLLVTSSAYLHPVSKVFALLLPRRSLRFAILRGKAMIKVPVIDPWVMSGRFRNCNREIFDPSRDRNS